MDTIFVNDGPKLRGNLLEYAKKAKPAKGSVAYRLLRLAISVDKREKKRSEVEAEVEALLKEWSASQSPPPFLNDDDFKVNGAAEFMTDCFQCRRALEEGDAIVDLDGDIVCNGCGCLFHDRKKEELDQCCEDDVWLACELAHEEAKEVCVACGNGIEDFSNNQICACDVNCCDECAHFNPNNDDDHGRYCVECIALAKPSTERWTDVCMSSIEEMWCRRSRCQLEYVGCVFELLSLDKDNQANAWRFSHLLDILKDHWRDGITEEIGEIAANSYSELFQ